MRLFSKSLTASICLHGLAIAYFVSHPFLFKTIRGPSIASSSLDLPEVKEEALQDFFSRFSPAPGSFRPTLPVPLASTTEALAENVFEANVSSSLASLSKPIEGLDLPNPQIAPISAALDPFAVESPSSLIQDWDHEWVRAHDLSHFLLSPSTHLSTPLQEEKEELLYAAREFFSPLSPDVTSSPPASFDVDAMPLEEEQFFAFSGAPFVDSIDTYTPSFPLLPPADKKENSLEDPAIEVHFAKVEEEKEEISLLTPDGEEAYAALLPETTSPNLVLPEIAVNVEQPSFSLALPSTELLEEEAIASSPSRPLSKENDLHYLSDYSCPLVLSKKESILTVDGKLSPIEESVPIAKPTELPSELPSLAESALATTQFSLTKPDHDPVLDRASADFPIVSNWKDKTLSLKRSLPNISAYGLLGNLPTILWNEDFSIDAHFEPRKGEKGYLFSLTLTPKFDMNAKSFPQNFYFVIDQISSLDRQKFNTFRKGLLKALERLESTDKFNIVVLGGKQKQLFDTATEANAAALRKAREFLDSAAFSRGSGRGELLGALQEFLPKNSSPEESHTAILLTSAETKNPPVKQKKAFEQWMQKNQGNVSLYTAALGNDNNFLFLDMLSSCNRGRLLYSDTHAAFPRRLTKLVMNLKNPIGKDLMATVVASSGESSVQLLTTSTHLPDLMAGTSYQLMGITEDLSSFTVLLQGRHKGEWFTVKKRIVPELSTSAKTLSSSFKQKLALLCYEKFLKEGSPEALEEAEDFLRGAHPRFRWK